MRYRTRIITLSDKGHIGQREDTSGPALREMLRSLPELDVAEEIPVLPDSYSEIRETLQRHCDQCWDLIVTTGGTGVSPRDVTPEATRAVIDREIPGMAEAMRAASLRKTPHAMISRAMVGLAGSTMIVNLPGSRKAALENMEVLLPALVHCLAKATGDPSDCGS